MKPQGVFPHLGHRICWLLKPSRHNAVNLIPRSTVKPNIIYGALDYGPFYRGSAWVSDWSCAVHIKVPVLLWICIGAERLVIQYMDIISISRNIGWWQMMFWVSPRPRRCYLIPMRASSWLQLTNISHSCPSSWEISHRALDRCSTQSSSCTPNCKSFPYVGIVLHFLHSVHCTYIRNC